MGRFERIGLHPFYDAELFDALGKSYILRDDSLSARTLFDAELCDTKPLPFVPQHPATTLTPNGFAVLVPAFAVFVTVFAVTVTFLFVC